MRVLSIIAITFSCGAVLAGCEGPISPEARQYLQAADTAYRQGDNPAAIEAGSRFIRMYPRSQEAGEAYYIRGLASRRTGRVDLAEDDFRTALSLTRRDDLIALIHCNLGDLAYYAGRTDEAEKHYRAVLEHTPSGVPPADEAMFRLGCVLQRQGRWLDADLLFSRVMQLFDGTPPARFAAERARAVRWSIQAAAMNDADAAAELRERLRLAGLDARTDLELRDGRVVHLVRVGSYDTYPQAKSDVGKVRKHVSDAFVTPAR